MVNLRILALVVCATLIVAVNAQAPIPSRPDGYAIGSDSAPVVLEVFYDLMCPDSRASWPNIQQVLTHYGPTKLKFVMHLFPLPYHHNSFYANQGGLLIAQQLNSSAIFTWMETVYANQEKYGNPSTADMTPNTVIASMGALSAKVGLVSETVFVAGINNPTVDYDLRISWKYGCSRAVVGTPTFLVNGVFVNASPAWNLSQWEQLLDPIFNQQMPPPVLEPQNSCPNNETDCQYLPGKYQCCLPGEFCIPNVGCRC